MSDNPLCTILIVDDQPSHLTVMDAILEPLGLNILSAQSGTEALRQLLSTDVAVILLDIDMPIMDGLETARLIRRRERSRYTPIVFVSSRGMDDPAFLEAYAAGAIDFLTKPVNPAVVRSKVSIFVELYRQRQRIREQAELLVRREEDAIRRDLARKHLLEIQAIGERQRRFLIDILSSVTEGRLCLCGKRSDLPETVAPLSGTIRLCRPDHLRILRQHAHNAAEQIGLPGDRRMDFVTAVSEAGMNAIVHANKGTARFFEGPGSSVQAKISDHGPGISLEHLPRATIERGFSTKNSLGHGFWLILRTIDRLHLLTRPTGTTIVIEQGRVPIEPGWLEISSTTD